MLLAEDHAAGDDAAALEDDLSSGWNATVALARRTGPAANANKGGSLVALERHLARSIERCCCLKARGSACLHRGACRCRVPDHANASRLAPPRVSRASQRSEEHVCVVVRQRCTQATDRRRGGHRRAPRGGVSWSSVFIYLLAAGEKGRSRHFACARVAIANGEPGTGLLQRARSL